MVPSLKALRALSFIAAEGSFERAGERLGVSRSAVSHLIRDLERQLGVRLLNRARRGVTLTQDGRALLNCMGDAIQRIEAAIEAFRRDRNQIRLTAVATFAVRCAVWTTCFPPLMPWTARANGPQPRAVSTTSPGVNRFENPSTAPPMKPCT